MTIGVPNGRVSVTTQMTATHLLKITVLLGLIFGAYLMAQWVDVGEVLNPDRVAAHLQAAGPLAPVVFMLLMVMAVVISPLPSLPLDLAAGATFGVLPGTVYAVMGAEIGAILSFLIGRALGREAVTRLFRTDVRFCERCSDRHLAIFVFLSRLVPIFSFDLISYGAGLTNMSLRVFAVATLLGMIPPTFALTYAGGSVVSGEWLVILLGVVMVAFLLLVPKLVIRYPSSRWVRLLQGGSPMVVVNQTTGAVPKATGGQPNEALYRCSSCGERMGGTTL